MRRASETDHFPYGYPGMVCYFILRNGELTQCSTRDQIRLACRSAIAGELTLYAVWPGQYRSDLFLIDDLTPLAEAIKA